MKFTSMFEFFIDYEFITVCLCGFFPGDSCTSQLLKHEIQKSFNESPAIDVKNAFLDIFRLKGPVYKLKSIN